MATKKQKRQRAEEKRAAYMEELRRTGLEAQRKDRESRKRAERKAWQEQHDKKHNWKNRVKQCPLCRDFMAPSTQKRDDHESTKVAS